jgi:hypothetical protein
VSGASGATGAYAFRLLDVDAVASHQLQLEGGPLLDRKLARGDQTDVYQFDAVAGQRYLLGGPGDQAVEGSVYWRLLDPTGQQIWTSDATPSDIATFAMTGTYTVLVEGRAGRTDPTGYHLYVFTPQDRQIPLALDGLGTTYINVGFDNTGAIDVRSGILEAGGQIYSS